MVESKLGWGGIDFNNEIVGANVGDLGIPMINPKTTIKEHGNSVDAICANPLKNGQFSSGSHDKTIMIWDANVKCIKTLTGHTNGVWCLNPEMKEI